MDYRRITEGTHRRTFTIGADNAVNRDQRTVRFSFASEYPIERWFGLEVLDMSASSLRSQRLDLGAPLLLEHDTNKQIGIVESYEIDESARKAYATVRFSRSPLAEEIYQDIIDGIRRNVSFAYYIHNIQEEVRGGQKVFVSRDWEVYEISIVSVPADPTVGVGRSENLDKVGALCAENLKHEVTEKMDATMKEAGATPSPQVSVTRAESDEDIILALGQKYDALEMAREYALLGKTAQEFRQALAESLRKQQPQIPQAASIDLSEREKKNYSIVRLIRSIASNNLEKADFEREVSVEIERRSGIERKLGANSVLIPTNLSARTLSATLGGQSDGGALVATTLLADEFIDLLRSRTVVTRLGARMLSGLVGNVAIPRQTGAGQAYWLGENQAPTASQLQLAQLNLTPRTIGAKTVFTRQLLLQSTPSIERVVREDLAEVLARGVDKAALTGSGTGNEPRGIFNTTGVNSITIPANATFEFTHAVQMESLADDQNAPQNARYYVCRPTVYGTLKTRPKTAAYPEYLISDDGTMNGYGVEKTTQLPGTHIVFGDFSQVVLGEWGVLELDANPYENFDSGGVSVRALWTVDVGVRYPQAFTVCTNFA